MSSGPPPRGYRNGPPPLSSPASGHFPAAVHQQQHGHVRSGSNLGLAGHDGLRRDRDEYTDSRVPSRNGYDTSGAGYDSRRAGTRELEARFAIDEDASQCRSSLSEAYELEADLEPRRCSDTTVWLVDADSGEFTSVRGRVGALC